MKGYNNDDLRRKNRGLLLRLIATAEASTRISLAKKSGLTKMSVTNIVDEFLKQGLVEEGEMEYQGQKGRNPVTLKLSGGGPRIVGLLINRESCGAVLCDLKLGVCKKEIRPLNAVAEEEFLSCLYELVDRMLAGETKVLGIGAASIGPLDVERGILLNPPRFYGIRNVSLRELFQERYGLPVFLDHQYNSAARAERLFGIGREYHSFLFVGITNGIGAGIYVDGRLLGSANGLGSELGHMSIDYRGNPCECGNLGCVETYASVNVICEQVGRALGRPVDFPECCRRYREPEVDAVFKDALEKLAVCLVNVVNLVNPEVVFLGHESVHLPDCYLEQMEKRINEGKLSDGYRRIRVLRATFGEEQQLAGAACNVLDQIFEGKLGLEEALDA